MAWLEQRKNGNFHIVCRLGGKRCKRSLETDNKRRANRLIDNFEENQRLLKRGLLTAPQGVDLIDFLLSDGRTHSDDDGPTRIRLGELLATYMECMPTGALTFESMRVATIHMNHFCRILGESQILSEISAKLLQRYVSSRSRQSGVRGRPLSPTTIKKELSTFNTIWSWAQRNGYVDYDMPKRDLKFPRQQERPPFQTWDQIEHQVSRGNLDDDAQYELWDCLYLTLAEMQSFLEHIENASVESYLYPMCTIAVYTGARRSELCRSREQDFDFDAGILAIREKKRVKARTTFRHVPLTIQLSEIIKNWFATKAPSVFTFPANGTSARKWSRARWELSDTIAPDDASELLNSTLQHSKWQRLRGWHVFRHSFISLCASKGVDQRMIDSWVGHQTDEMRRRYTHLFPNSQQDALSQVFQ